MSLVDSYSPLVALTVIAFHDISQAVYLRRELINYLQPVLMSFDGNSNRMSLSTTKKSMAFSDQDSDTESPRQYAVLG